MKKKTINDELDILDFLARGRRNKTKPFTFSDQKAGVGRTARRVPEVMVKVSGGGKSVKQVFNHLTYLTRNGDLEAVTENGDKVASRDELRDLLDEWDLESSRGYGRAKLAFNLVLSMPKGTDAKRLHQAVKEFVRDQFWERHQYVMVLHEDKDHPHVHICVKAQAMDGKQRLYIRKATLETWRQKFAENLREHGIAANATPRELRGVTRKSKKIGLYYAEKAGRSNVLVAKIREVAESIQKGEKNSGAWDMALAERRDFVVQLYQKAASELRQAGDKKLAQGVESFAASLPPIITERDMLGAELIRLIRNARARDAKKSDVRSRQEKVGHVQLPETERSWESKGMREIIETVNTINEAFALFPGDKQAQAQFLDQFHMHKKLQREQINKIDPNQQVAQVKMERGDLDR